MLTDYRVKGVSQDVSEERFVQILREGLSPVPKEAALSVYHYASSRQLSGLFILAMFTHESSMGRAGWAVVTHSWGNTCPPSFGPTTPTGAYNQDTRQFYRWADERPVARYLVAYPDWEQGGISTVARFFDHAPYQGKDTVRAIVPTWAPSRDGNNVEGYIAAVLADIERWAVPPKEQAMARICIAAGHHNSDGGDALEKIQTGFLTAAVAKACRAAGMDVKVVTPGDGAGMFPGGIWDVAAAVVMLAKTGWVPDIFLETHTEGGGGTGVFAIFPDWDNDVDADVKDKLGPDVSLRIAKATGLKVGGRQNGTMSEKQTGVGGTGFRLGIFNKTAPIAATTTRLIIEYGAHDKEPDLGIVKLPGFYEASGRATAEAFAAFLGVAPPPPPPPLPPTPPVVGAVSPLVKAWKSLFVGGKV